MLNKLILLLRRAVDPVDRILDGLTSYRLVLYFLLLVICWAAAASLISQEVPFAWYEILVSAAWLMAVCRASNWLACRLLNIPRNHESDFITALILALIISPADSAREFAILAAGGTIAMLSKYVLVIGKRHIFNPAALGALAMAQLFSLYTSWWVGLSLLTPVVLIGGLLIIRKIRRFSMLIVFLTIYLAITALNIHDTGGQLGHGFWLTLSSSSVLFFAFIMLPEPSTSPKNTYKYLIYAALVALLYSVGEFRLDPIEALLIGNALAFGLEPGRRVVLFFAGRKKEADGIYSYLFHAKNKPGFRAGQYMEWTLPTSHMDSRGNRRYFTISSAPSEKNMTITLRLPSPSSSFKQALNDFKPGDKILGSHPVGSFVASKDTDQKVALVAGGIGITPFRSMVKDWLDSGQQRDAALLYVVNDPGEFAFGDLFAKAGVIGLKTVYSITNPQNEPPGWKGLGGPLSQNLLKKAIPDYRQRLFYISGPYGFVKAARESLLKSGVAVNKIVSDYFPGYG